MACRHLLPAAVSHNKTQGKTATTKVIATKVIATRVTETKATETRTALGIAVGAVTVVAVVTARIGQTTAAVISKTRRRNRHKTKAVVTSHGSRSSPAIAAHSHASGNFDGL